MKNGIKLTIIALVVVATANLVQATGSCPINLATVENNAKAAGWNSIGEFDGFCNQYCDAGSKAVPHGLGAKLLGHKADEAAKCACYCKLKATDYKARDKNKAERYKVAATKLSEFADANNIDVSVAPQPKK
jgi:hypothetical protein